MLQEVVGKIEGYDVLYLPEKELLFCKNTTMPYKTMRYALLEQKVDKLRLKHDLVMSVDERIVSLGCLITNMENIENINENIKRIRNGKRISQEQDY